MPELDLSPHPPRVERRPHRVDRPDGVVDDPYHWLRERDDPAVRAHLEAENAYAEQVLAPLAELRAGLFEEIRGRIRETDASVPVLDGGWLYYRRTLAGAQYPIRCRRPAPDGVVDDVRALSAQRRRAVDPWDPPADEVVLLDENAEADGQEYYRLGAFAVSPDHRLAAEAVDLTGNEVFTIRVRELVTGRLLDDEIPRAAYGLAWYDDSATFLYTVPDDAWRPHEVWRHRLGTPASEDERLVVEPDERYWLGVGRTRSDAYLAVVAGSKVTSEWSLLPADDPAAPPRLVAAREEGVEYDLDHRGERLYLVTNADGARDFKLCVAPVDDPGRDRWQELIGHRPGIRLESADAFAHHLVLSERTQARTQLRIVDPDTGLGEVLEVEEEVAATALGANPVFDRSVLRIGYTSLTTPGQVIDVDLVTGTREVLKQQEVGGGFDRDDYVSWRDWATAPDGTRVPISLVRHVRTPLDGTAACLLYGYGSYELSIDPGFSSSRLSLLDRGVVFAIAHVRGGGELGRAWYEQGRLHAKPNTFHDLVACADQLFDAQVTRRERLAIRGGSAGGLLVGAALNLRPALCAAAVAEVPFVDVLATMSDPSLPLTVIEYEEWGNPADPEFYPVIAGYSPVDNVQAAAYPALYVTAGLNDPRVQYWEPAKWVARLRDTATGGGPVLLETKLGAGHGGRSGRYDAWQDEATVLAFLLATLGVSGDPPADPCG